MTTTAELYSQSELNKKLIQEIADEIKTTAERLYQDINTSPQHSQPKVDFTESATWKKAQNILSTVPSTSVHKANDIVITEQFKSPRAASSDPFNKQGDILAKPISSHLLSPPGHNANRKFDELISKADLIISKSPRRHEINAVTLDNLNLKTLPKSPVIASAFAETYNSSAKPAHTRHVSSPHGEIKLGDFYSGIDINKIRTEYQPIQITVSAPRDYKEEYKTSTNTLVSSHEYKSTPVYTDKLLNYETSIQKPFDLYSPIEPKNEVVYNIESSYKPENKYYDHAKLDVVLGNIAKRKGMSPEALKSPPKSNLKIITESNNPNHYYSGQQNLPQYIDRPVETITQSAQFNLGDYKSSGQPIQYESIYHSSKPTHLEYGVGTVPTKDKLRDPYDLSLAKLVERATLESGYGSALIRDDYSSIHVDSIPKKKTLGYETRSPRSPERSIIERVEALENDLDSLIVEFKETGKYPQGLERPGQGLTGYQGLYRGRYEEYGNEVETRHKSPYAAGNEGLVYVKDLDKRRLHQGQSYQGGVSVSNKERIGASPERYVVGDVGRREGNTWRDEDRYRLETNYERRDWNYNPTEHGEIREQDFRKPRDRRELSPESYRRAYEYEGDVNRYSPQGRYYSPPRSNTRSPKYTNKTEQVTPTRADKRQDSGQKGTNKIEKVFIY